MAKKSNVLSFVVLGVAGYAVFKYLPGVLRSVSASSGGGTVGSTTAQNPIQKAIASLLKPAAGTPSPVGLRPVAPTAPTQPNPPKAPSSMPPLSAGTPNGSKTPNIGGGSGSGMESVAKALYNGDYNSFDQNVLAGIFNIQNGGGDFAGDSRASMSDTWLTGDNSLLSSGVQDFIPYQQLDYMSNIPTQDIPSGDSTGSMGGYADTSNVDFSGYSVTGNGTGGFYDSGSGTYAGGYFGGGTGDTVDYGSLYSDGSGSVDYSSYDNSSYDYADYGF